MNRDHHDALIDQLLREILGGDRPRDLTERVMARACAYDRSRHRWWISSAAGIAAAIAIGIGVWTWWPREYPAPQLIHGTVAISTPNIEDGSHIETGEDGASVKLGGYVDLTLAPDTALILGGKKFEEKIFLEHGQIDAQVTRNRGKFDVAVGAVNVHVTGTKFAVKVLEELDATQTRRQKKVEVRVREGSVVVQGTASPATLLAGNVGTFEVSSAPVLRSMPPGLAGGAAANRQGLLAGAQEGNRIGSRGGQAVRPVNDPVNRGGTTIPATRPTPAPEVLTGEITDVNPDVMVQMGTVTLPGTLRRNRDAYYLETEKGNFQLFHAQSPPAGFKGEVGRRYRVTWVNKNFYHMEPVETPNGGGR